MFLLVNDRFYEIDSYILIQFLQGLSQHYQKQTARVAKQRKSTAHHPRFGSCDGEVCLGDRNDGGGAGVVESLGVRKKCHLRMQIAVTRRTVT